MNSKKLEELEAALSSKDLSVLIRHIPYAQLLGLDYYAMGDQFIYQLPKNDDNLGNPTLPAIHGGVIGGFMETAGALHVMISSGTPVIPKIVDFSLDYLSPGRHTDTFARCAYIRQGRRMANIAVTAWQTRESKPIAVARAHFLLV